MLLLISCQETRTPLYWAGFSGHVAVVKALLMAGADSSLADSVSTVNYLCLCGGEINYFTDRVFFFLNVSSS